MEEREQQSEKYIKAQMRVKQIKQFYRHLKVYLVVNILFFVAKFRFITFFNEQGIQDEGFYSWIAWNAILWGIGLFVQWVYVFKWQKLKPSVMKDWEAKQMTKFLEEEYQRNATNKK